MASRCLKWYIPCENTYRKNNNVYIKNFDEELDDDRLKEMFEQYGKIISAKVMYDGSGKSRGFGFVSFEEPEAAERAVTAMNSSEIGGKQLYCGLAQKKAERQAKLKAEAEKVVSERTYRFQGMNLYVKNLDTCVDDERLRKEFSEYGTITSAKVMVEGGRSRCFGFVCFSSPEEATKALTEMNGRMIENKSLYVALAECKKDRRARQAIERIQKMASMHQKNVHCNPIVNSGVGCVVPWMQHPQRDLFPIRLTHSSGATAIRPNHVSSPLKFPPAPYSSCPRQMPERPSGPMAQPHQPVLVPGQDPLTATMLAAAPPQEQKQMLGERLFPLIQRMYPDLAGKITDMLLEIHNSELLYMLESHESLKFKVEEAVAVLQAHQAKEQAAAKKE